MTKNQLDNFDVGKGVGRNFSGGGLSGPQGRAPQPFFKVQGGDSTPIFGRFSGQNERIFGSVGGHGPPCLYLHTPMRTGLLYHAYIAFRLFASQQQHDHSKHTEASGHCRVPDLSGDIDRATNARLFSFLLPEMCPRHERGQTGGDGGIRVSAVSQV